MYWDGILLILCIYKIKEVTGRQPSNRYLAYIQDDEIQDITKHRSPPTNPLIVYVNYKNGAKIEDSDWYDLFFSGDDGIIGDDDGLNFYRDEAKEQAKYLLYNYLLQKSSSRSPNPKPALLRALRSRCADRSKCEKTCQTKKKKSNCVPKCGQKYDNQNICKPPKPKFDPCKPTSDCGSQKWGKTMPPPPRGQRLYSQERCGADSCDKSNSCNSDEGC